MFLFCLPEVETNIKVILKKNRICARTLFLSLSLRPFGLGSRLSRPFEVPVFINLWR